MATDRAGTDIDFASNGDRTNGYLAVPASGRGPGLIVIQEWWGLVPHIRDVCDRLARAGFVALAPDLYHGQTGADPEAAERLMMDLQIDRAARDLDGTVKALLDNHAVDGARVGAVGFCMGGQLALFAATRNRRIGAVADFYGLHPNVELDLSGLTAPVLGIFGGDDDYIPAESVAQLEADLKAAGARAKIDVVPGVGHAFMNDSSPEAYDATAAERCWDQLLAFFRGELS